MTPEELCKNHREPEYSRHLGPACELTSTKALAYTPLWPGSLDKSSKGVSPQSIMESGRNFLKGRNINP